jgi:perosamine synthetase
VLFRSLGPGEEVILPPYTFVATYNVIVANYALPVFVDSDPDTFQIDARKVESAITKQTKAILPVHIGGNVADLDTLLATARKHSLPLVEDACQAHLAEWRGRVVGNWGLAGCYSFQASKNLTSGEGGAVLCNDDAFAEKVYTFQGQARPRTSAGYNFSYVGDRAANYRMPEFQAGLLMAQLTRLGQQAKTRDENAACLSDLCCDIPGFRPVRLYDGCTRSSRLLLMFRYQKEHFANLDRAKFIAALAAEGIHASTGYTPLNTDNYVKALAVNPHYVRLYGKKRMARWLDRNQCPVNDKICAEAVWLPQTVLLGTKSDMKQIAEAVRNIQAHAREIARKS